MSLNKTYLNIIYTNWYLRGLPTQKGVTKWRENMLEYLIFDSPTIKVLDFFLDEPQLDYSKKDIAEKTGVSWKTIDNMIPTLKKYEIIQFSRKINKAMLFKVNLNSRVLKALKNLDFEVTDIERLSIKNTEEAKPAEAIA